ncbi:MAG: double zinc ribbon domain-containing protein, partial [Acidimicrobiales bacterium]
MPACQSCGSENPPANRFCAYCGTSLASICPSCGGAVEADHRFCGQCGAAVPAMPAIHSGGSATAHAGSQAQGSGRLPPPAPGGPGAPASGTWLTALPSAPGGPTSAGRDGSTGSSRSERRVCSVLFCDLVGFTPYSQSRDPEEVRAMLSLYFERA